MNEMNGPGDDRIDLVIAEILARRAVGGSAETLAGSPLSTDEALVAELAALSELDWPADQAGDRIAMSVTAAGPLTAASAETATVATRGRRPRRAAPRRRPARSRWLGVGAVAAAAALVAGAIQLIGDSHGPASRVAGSAAPRHNSAPKSPTRLTAMTIVSKPGALSRVGVVGGGNAFLTCVTRDVCYVDGWAARGVARFVARSTDGGVTWIAGAPMPAIPLAPDGDSEWNMQVSCITPMTCVSAYETGVVETSDGFAHIRFHRITALSGHVDWVSCPTAQHCAAAVILGNNARKFEYSDDGGRTWTMAVAPSIGTDFVVAMTCDPNGECIAALSGGDEENGTVAALSSSDSGRSWVMSATYSMGSEQQYWASCSDGQDCVVGGNWGAIPLAWIHVAGGKINIRLRQVPQAAGTGISCATARDCFVVSGDTIVATQDGGHSWTTAPGGEATLVDVSCPVAAGCVGIAQNNGDSWIVVSDLQHGR